MRLSYVLTATAMTVRELSRKRLVLVLALCVPVVFFATALATTGEDLVPVSLATHGRFTLVAERRRALVDAPRMLRLTEPLQQAAWNLLLGEVERPMRTTVLANRLRISREHLSRQFGAGGAPNLKRVIDLTRIACAAQLLGNPGYAVQTVVRVLHFSSSNHLARSARRIANVPTSGLGALGPRGVLAAFVRGNTRSRM